MGRLEDEFILVRWSDVVRLLEEVRMVRLEIESRKILNYRIFYAAFIECCGHPRCCQVFSLCSSIHFVGGVGLDPFRFWWIGLGDPESSVGAGSPSRLRP